MSPICVYRCPKGHEHEWLVRFGRRPPTRCPECGRKLEQKPTAHAPKRDGTYSYREGE